jgi:DNA-binding CsgD family transcriptional regulator
MKDSSNQEDWLRTRKAIRGFNDKAEALLPRISTPTLVIAFREGRWVRHAGRFATGLPNAKVALFDEPTLGLWADGLQDEMPGIDAIDAFLRELLDETPAVNEVGAGLSSREIEVLRLITAGKSNQQIAHELVISLNTVRRHVSNIFIKIGVVNRAQAAVYAKEHGLA